MTEFSRANFNITNWVNTDYDRNVSPAPMNVKVPQMDTEGNIYEVSVPNMAKKKQEVDDFIGNARNNNVIITGNFIKDSFMQHGTEYYASAGGVVIEAVHPFTKAFEGPYVPDKPETAVDNPALATGENPFWFARYNKGSRLSRGGLGDGWNGISNGNILKITKEASLQAPASFQSVFFTSTKLAVNSRVRFRCYLNIVKGSCSFGTDAGFLGVHRGISFQAKDCSPHPENWLPVDIEVGTSETVTMTSSNFCMGFDWREDVEIYLALPEITLVPRSGNDMQIVQEM